MKESEVEKILVDEVRGAGGYAPKWVSPGNVGVPDRIVFLPWKRRPIFVEMKSDVGRLSDPQRVWAARLRDFGQNVRTVYGLAGLEEFFREIGMDGAAQRARAKRERMERRVKRDKAGNDRDV